MAYPSILKQQQIHFLEKFISAFLSNLLFGACIHSSGYQKWRKLLYCRLYCSRYDFQTHGVIGYGTGHLVHHSIGFWLGRYR